MPLETTTLTDVVIWGLWLVIAVLGVASIVVIAGIWPWNDAPRIIREPSSPDAEWKCIIRLETSSLFAVHQPITADITFEHVNSDLENPKIIFKDVGGENIEVELTQCSDDGKWRGTSQLEYKSPGKPAIEYSAPGVNSFSSVGEIAPLTEYYHYLTNRFVLVFSAVTAILAAASLIISLSGP